MLYSDVAEPRCVPIYGCRSTRDDNTYEAGLNGRSYEPLSTHGAAVNFKVTSNGTVGSPKHEGGRLAIWKDLVVEPQMHYLMYLLIPYLRR